MAYFLFLYLASLLVDLMEKNFTYGTHDSLAISWLSDPRGVFLFDNTLIYLFYRRKILDIDKYGYYKSKDFYFKSSHTPSFIHLVLEKIKFIWLIYFSVASLVASLL